MPARIPTSVSRKQRLAQRAEAYDTTAINIETFAQTWRDTWLAQDASRFDLTRVFQTLIAYKTSFDDLKAQDAVLEEHYRNLDMRLSFDPGTVDTGLNQIDFGRPHGFETEDRIRFYEIADSTLPAPLPVDVNRAVIKVGPNILAVAANVADATAGTRIDLTTAGTGQFIITAQAAAANNDLSTDMQTAIDAIKTVYDANNTPFTLDGTGATGENGVTELTVPVASMTSVTDALDTVAKDIE